MRRRLPHSGAARLACLVAVVAGATMVSASAALGAHDQEREVTVGSNDAVFSQNKQNEPAIAVDASHPNVLAAGANDNIDMEDCDAGDPTTCPFTPNVGGTGIQFSFDAGDSWIQPTYTGFTARHCVGPPGFTCVPGIGPIGTLPWYFESGLVSDGDPALAFGPRRGANGTFSWANGSRLYVANLASNISADLGEPGFRRGFEAIAVSRLDAPASTGLTAAIASNKNSWRPPVVVSKQSNTAFSDKEQVWADNAASSRFFGNVYVCWVEFRSLGQGNAFPSPLVVAVSRDGGDTWRKRQLTPAAGNIQHLGATGCTIRTDSRGVVYVFAVEFALGFPGFGWHIMMKSFDGGQNWTRPRRIFTAVDTCNAFDVVILRCVQDGVAGARNDLGPAPSVDIANGAPTGADATDAIYDTWVDGRDGLNREHVMLSYSADGGDRWTTLPPIEQPGDRGYYSAPGVAPDGKDLYLVYNAFTTPYRPNTTEPRKLVGVVLHSSIGLDRAPGGFSEVHRGQQDPGDARGSSQNNLEAEFLGDYVYAIGTRTYGAAVWNDTRFAADCPAIDAWRFALRPSGDPLPAGASRQPRTPPGAPPAQEPPPAPAVEVACPDTPVGDQVLAFGNTDIWGWSGADPTPAD
jgi:hypothetical protein